MLVYRFQKTKYAHLRADILSGEGAKLVGGRWNPKGLAVVYASATPELAHQEYLIHLKNLPPPSCHLVTLQIPDESILEIKKEDLPTNWRSKNEPTSTRLIGKEWLLKAEYLVLQVPSAIVPMSYNYLINPNRPLIEKVNVVNSESFIFDERIVLEKPTPLMPSVFVEMLNPK